MASSVLEIPEIRNALWEMSVEQYHGMSASGLVAEKTELIRGLVIKKMTKSPEHSFSVDIIARFLRSVFETRMGYFVSVEQPLTLSDSEPEPDISVVAGRLEDFKHAHPRTARLVVEVAVTTQAMDREKAALYAEAGVDEYWLVDHAARKVEVYTQPGPAGYQSKLELNENARLEIENRALKVCELF